MSYSKVFIIKLFQLNTMNQFILTLEGHKLKVINQFNMYKIKDSIILMYLGQIEMFS